MSVLQHPRWPHIIKTAFKANDMSMDECYKRARFIDNTIMGSDFNSGPKTYAYVATTFKPDWPKLYARYVAKGGNQYHGVEWASLEDKQLDFVVNSVTVERFQYPCMYARGPAAV